VKKSPNDHKNGPNNPPTNLIQLKFRPTQWAFFPWKKSRNAKKIAQMAKFFPILSH
jgi:hypothetical protein